MKTRNAGVGLSLWVLAACPGGDDGNPTGAVPSSTGSEAMTTTGSHDSSDGTQTSSTEDTGATTEAAETTFGCDLLTWYPDADEDGYGDVNLPVDACLQPPVHIAQGGDCDDANPEVHPGVDEICDMADNDCNGLIDEASPVNASCQGCTLGLAGTHGYYYCPQALARADAQSFCEQLGGNLVTIDDQAEQDFVLAEPLPAVPLLYIGLNDLEVEGTFVWADGGVPGFLAWGMGEPNDALEGEDCVQLAVPAGTWNDIACATAAAFICEAIGSGDGGAGSPAGGRMW